MKRNDSSIQVLNIRKLILIVVTSVSLMTFNGCEEDDVITGHIFEDVQGVVLDSLTLQPIDSVTITFLDTAATSTPHFTDTLGAFKFGIGGNQSPLFFRKPGYETKFLRADKNDTLMVLMALE